MKKTIKRDINREKSKDRYQKDTTVRHQKGT